VSKSITDKAAALTALFTTVENGEPKNTKRALSAMLCTDGVCYVDYVEKDYIVHFHANKLEPCDNALRIVKYIEDNLSESEHILVVFKLDRGLGSWCVLFSEEAAAIEDIHDLSIHLWNNTFECNNRKLIIVVKDLDELLAWEGPLYGNRFRDEIDF
jgi:hypothetical protein